METADGGEQIAELVEAALEVEGAERVRFLDEACGQDRALRAEVESLLHFQALAKDFIEKAACHIAAETLAAEGELRAGQELGGFKILSLLGEGGMGGVYLAEDTQLGRTVAIKLIKRAFHGLPAIGQFEQEERILAALNHPHIAHLYGVAATSDGLPYIVMEYVEGEPLDRFHAAKAHSIPALLELFRKICSAVSYAHQHLVIHRDLKPANICVTPEGEPKLLDFGIARLLDDATGSERTSLVAGLMTPAYASPEQARGESLTTASDVYSLGVILYEMLTGEKPYRLTNQKSDDIARAITEAAPLRPSLVAGRPGLGRKRQPSLRGDLDSIVLRAMEKDPAQRYPTAGQLSEDIRRYLEGFPVSARKAPWGYRSGKFIGRHKAGVLAAVLLACTLMGGIATTTRQARRAERRFADVRHLANALLFEIAPKIERLEGATDARQAVLTQSLKYLDRLACEAQGDDALQSELAAAYEKIGDLQGNPTNPNLIALSDSLTSYGKASAIRLTLVEKHPAAAEDRRLLANNYRALGDIHYQTNEPAESLKDSEAALSIYDQLLATEPGSMDLRLARARTLHDIGVCFSTNGKKAESMSYFHQTIAAAEELRRENPDTPAVLALLADGHRQLGNALSWELKQAPAEAEMAAAIAIYENLTAAHPSDVGLRTGLYQTFMMASNVYEEVDNPRAHQYARQALGIIESMVEKDPANLRARQQMAKTWSRLGVTLANINRPDESIAFLEKAVAGLEAITQRETRNRRFLQDLALAWMRLGDARRQQGALSGALDALEKSIALFSHLAEGHSADNTARRNLASASASLAQTHESFAVQAKEKEAQSHRALARESRDLAIVTLRQLEARGALSKFDRNTLEQMEKNAETVEHAAALTRE